MIKSVTIKSFMAHTELKATDIPEINVIIGKNDAGKTGLLKLLYSTVKSLEIYSVKKGETPFKKELAEKMLNTFMPVKNGLGDLVQKGNSGKLDINVTITDLIGKYKQPIYFSFGDTTQSTITSGLEHIDTIPTETSINALFIPAKEVLTAFNDISNIRDNFYGKGFDDTYFDLIKALRLPTTKGRVASELSDVNKSLEDLFDGKIEQTKQKDQPFVFKRGRQQFAMQPVSYTHLTLPTICSV